MSELKKRTWHYIHPPDFYECMCENDQRYRSTVDQAEPAEPHPIAWSEYAGMIWCFTCKIDTRGFGGIFDGPIPAESTKMILGQDCFDRWDMKKREVQTCCMGKRNIYYKRDKARTRQMRAAILNNEFPGGK